MTDQQAKSEISHILLRGTVDEKAACLIGMGHYDLGNRLRTAHETWAALKRDHDALEREPTAGVTDEDKMIDAMFGGRAVDEAMEKRLWDAMTEWSGKRNAVDQEVMDLRDTTI